MRHFAVTGALLVFLLYLNPNLFAQQFNFTHYSAVDGLGSSSINYIFQDSRGYIWFATQGGGLSRFNGRQFETFTRQNGLISNNVTFITEDKSKHLWIATAAGASEYDGLKFVNYAKKEGLVDGTVYSIYSDADGKIWFATQDAGIRILNDGRWDSITTKDGLSSNQVYTLTCDKANTLWIGLSNGISSCRHKKILNYTNAKAVGDKTFFSSFTDVPGNVWFGSTSGQVVKIAPTGEMINFNLPGLMQHDFIGGITADNKGNMWFATDHGLLRFNCKDFETFGEQQGLSVNSAQAVMCDYEGNIWAGTLTGGASVLNSLSFFSYSAKDGLDNRNITCVCKLPGDSVIFIGTSSGIYIYTPKLPNKIRKITEIKELQKINISSMAASRDGKLWITAIEGVYELEQTKAHTLHLVNTFYKLNGQAIISPTKIICDNKGTMWLSCYGAGLFRINAGGSKCYNTGNGFLSDKILTVFEDHKGGIWIGTEDKGLIRYDGKNFERFSVIDTLPDKSVWSIAQDGQGNMYFGTAECGLLRYDGRNLTRYTSADGLIADYIPVLLWDTVKNSLWAGGDKGLEQITFSGPTIKFNRIYTSQDGLKQSSINQNGLYADESGFVYICTVDGLWLFDDKFYVPQNIAPKISFTGLRLFFGKEDVKKYADSIEPQSHIPINLVLPYNQNHLTFGIQALTTQDVVYLYKLQGSDQQWSIPGRNNEITYTNIEPGKNYTFLARAVDAKNNLSSETLHLAFTINPPWWNTWWFRIIGASFLIVGVVLFVKARERVLINQNTKLEHTVAERTLELVHQKEVTEQKNNSLEILNQEKNNFLNIVAHDLKNPLGIVRTFAEISADPKTASEKREGYIQNIALATDRMYELVNNLLDINSIESGKINLHLNKVNLNKLLLKYLETASPIVIKRNIQLRPQLPALDVYLETDEARLTQVIENYVSNAVKYSPSGTIICIQLIDRESEIEIRVKDQGQGIAETELHALFKPYGVASSVPLGGENQTGLGLAIVKKIADALNATVGCDSIKDKGSEFYIRFLKT